MTEQLTFKTDFGESCSALGTYDPRTDVVNINLPGLMIESSLEVYGCLPFGPEGNFAPEAFEDYLITMFIDIETHEQIHKILKRFEHLYLWADVASICEEFDHLSPFLFYPSTLNGES